MCGIVGYTGPNSCVEILVDGLRRLEYRGYDSAGVAIQAGGGIAIRKSEGKIVRLTERIAKEPVSGTCGVGHTRWATHGRPSDENAHPHLAGRVAVIHNGIVENHRTLREKMIAKGRTFSSQTDSEVIAHLLDEHVSAGMPLEEAARKTVAELRGSYAFLAVTDREPGRRAGRGGVLPRLRPDRVFIPLAGRDLPRGRGVGDRDAGGGADHRLLGKAAEAGFAADRLVLLDGGERRLPSLHAQGDP